MNIDLWIHLITAVAVVLNTTINVILYRERRKKYGKQE